MTEFTKPNGGERGPRYDINPVAFVAALFLAPLFVTALSFWAIIPVLALPFAAIPYLVIGTPILFCAVGRVEPSFMNYAPLGLQGNLLNLPLGTFVFALREPLQDALTLAIFFTVFGVIFAPLYAGAFGMLYASFHPDGRGRKD